MLSEIWGILFHGGIFDNFVILFKVKWNFLAILGEGVEKTEIGDLFMRKVMPKICMAYPTAIISWN